MEVDGIAVARLQPVDAHGRAAAGLFGEIAGLAPFQRLGEPAHAGRPGGGVEHQLAQRHQLGAHERRICLEDRRDVVLEKRLIPDISAIVRRCIMGLSVILSAAKDLMPLATGKEVIRYAQDDERRLAVWRDP